jgi:class 3 adenylate cyclase
MREKRLIPLQVSIAAAFAIIVIATATLIGLSTFLAARSFIRESIRLRLQDIATLAAMPLQAADIAKIHSRADEQLPEYARLKQHLQQVRRINPEIRFTYLYRVDPVSGKVRAVVDNEPLDSKDLSHAGDPFPDATPLARQVYHAGSKAVAEQDFWTDRWGVYLSSYVPVVNAAGQVECGLGIDMSAQAVRDYERRFLFTLVAAALLIALIVLLASLSYSRRISRPLLAIAQDLGRVQRLELHHETRIRSNVREVVLMRDAVARMKTSLGSFRKYVPADLVADLMALGQEARLSAEKREVTIFFSDIADFTTISEKYLPEELVAQLSVYFDGMTRSLIEANATVDKYIGDAIMAFWGAPRENPDHAVQACLAALKCRDYSRRLGEQQLAAGGLPMFTRIGLNTGAAIIGNIGYEARLNYTAMGDMVNLGSRLEALNKFYGTQILMSESTWLATRHAVATRFIDVVSVKGKAIPVRIYELLCLQGDLSPDQAAHVSDYEAGVAMYLGRSFREAEEAFALLAAADPHDLATSRMLDRSRQFLKNPPPDSWQGEFIMTSK